MAKEKNTEIDNFKSTADLTGNPGFQSSVSIAEKTEDTPYVPFEHRNIPHPNTVFGSIVHLLKACLGTGLLAMPAAFKNAGLLVGAIGTIFVGIIVTHTVHVLVKISQELCVTAKKPSMSYSETCAATFTYGPKAFQSWSNFVKLFVDYSLCLCYISTLCVYVVFIGSSMKEVADVFYPDLQLSIQLYCAMPLIPLILICQIRNLKFLVPFSGIANISIFIVLVITFYYIFTDLPPMSERELVADVSSWPLFFSVVVFAMEGIGVVMPVENEMARPEKFLGCPGVLNISMVVVITLYGVVGFFGYVRFGNAVKGSITLNLPEGDIVAQVTKLLMAFVIFLTFAIQFYVPMEMINRSIKTRKNYEKYENLLQISIRTFIVCLAVGVAIAFPNLELVISFVGAFFFSTLGFLIPALIEIVYRWDKDLNCIVLVKDIIIIIISLVALISGAYVSIAGMIDEFFRHSDAEIYDNSTLKH